MKSWFSLTLLIWAESTGQLSAQPHSFSPTNAVGPTPARLVVKPATGKISEENPLVAPLPAHAVKAPLPAASPNFHVDSRRTASARKMEREPARAEYFLSDRDTKLPITPEISNLNLPADLEITATDTGEKIFLPAGTYRQILQLPIDSPLMQTTDQVRRSQALPVETKKEASRYAEPEKKPVWVRYESLEKVKIGEAERRGGIDLPCHGSKDLGPRVWYAKSETADVASSVFYFVFGGLGYSTANILGWSAGNTRAIPGDFEYRLIRR